MPDHNLTGLQPETPYSVEVQAVNADGPSGWSAPVTGTTAAEPPPFKPTPPPIPVDPPAVEYDAPLVNPAGGGLYAASAVIPAPAHWGWGVRILPVNCGNGFGTWEIDPCLNPAGLAYEWSVTATADYKLAVDGVETTTLTTTSTVAEIESALNATSGPVGLDVAGSSTSYGVSTDTAARLTATGGAAVAVTKTANVKRGSRTPPLDPFLPVVTWGYDECDPQETDEQVLTRARQNQRLGEQLVVESSFADRLLSEATDLGSVGDIVEAVSALESELAQLGILGVLHAASGWAALASSHSVLSPVGAVRRSPLGHTWAFGGGYVDTLDDTIVATGPITVWQSGYEEHVALDAYRNVRAAVVERAVIVGYECAAFKVTVAPAAP